MYVFKTNEYEDEKKNYTIIIYLSLPVLGLFLRVFGL